MIQDRSFAPKTMSSLSPYDACNAFPSASGLPNNPSCLCFSFDPLLGLPTKPFIPGLTHLPYIFLRVQMTYASNASISSFKIPKCRFMIISAAPLILTFFSPVIADINQLITVVESVQSSMSRNLHFKARLTPFNAASNSATLI